VIQRRRHQGGRIEALRRTCWRMSSWGKIKKWNDPRLLQSNRASKLPTLLSPWCTVQTALVRPGSSRTIYPRSVPTGPSPWATTSRCLARPAGWQGKPGVASYVQRINGAIGYVESAMPSRITWPMPSLKNHDGKFVDPTDDSVQPPPKAPTDARAQFLPWFSRQAGATSWPITGASFVLVRRQQRMLISVGRCSLLRLGLPQWAARREGAGLHPHAGRTWWTWSRRPGKRI